MALTNEQKKELMAVLDRTGGHREIMTKERVIPPEYEAYALQVTREEKVLELPGVLPVRCIITMAGDRSDNCPVHVNMHGGGFIFPQNRDDDLYCARLAAGIRGIVVDIDYATSDEHPFPVAFDQCYEVVRWVFGQCYAWGADAKKVSVGGHSAGGNLAAAISLKAAKTGDFDICFQVLDYAANDNYAPIEQEGMERSRAFSLLYADGEAMRLKEPYVSPFFAPDEMLRKQPPTLIVSAEKCPFTICNENYGLRLAHAGAEVTFRHFSESRHGFTVRMTDQWQEAQEAIIQAIRRASL